MEPETRRVYEELQSHETEFGTDADPEPPSRKECRTQVCVYLHAHMYMYKISDDYVLDFVTSRVLKQPIIQKFTMQRIMNLC
jgi:hypothetical protein